MNRISSFVGPVPFNPKDVVDTVNGLTTAVKFWGGFIGNQVFDAALIEGKIKELNDKRATLEKYASSDGVDATKRLNIAIWKINVCVTTIKSLAS